MAEVSHAYIEESDDTRIMPAAIIVLLEIAEEDVGALVQCWTHQ